MGLRRAAFGLLLCLALAAAPARAQEMEPKSYSPSPVGANFLVASYSRSTGDVVFDPTVPITDVNAHVQGMNIGVGHTFNLAGNLGLVTFGVPVIRARVTGNVFEQAAEARRTGTGDMRVKLSVNLRGNPAQTPREFASAPSRTIIGASAVVTAPTGQYNGTKLINLGTNRWSVKPEVGVSVPKGPWDIDAYAGVWLFASNADYYPGGETRTQSSLVSIQGHLSYTLRPRLWIALDGTWYHGGSARVADGDPTQPLNNSRLGLTASFPVGRRYSLKVAYGGGVVVRTGTDFNTVAVAWQTLWLSPRWAGR